MTPNSAPARRDVWVLAADSGCGACVQSIQALRAPRYVALLRDHGVRFALSPRQADVMLLTGAFSAHARTPLRRLLAAVPRPRALVAVGDCAIDGCVFRGSAALAADPAEALDVNIEIPGCPPAPTAIVEAIVVASHLLARQPERTTDGGHPAVQDTPMAATARPFSPAPRTPLGVKR